MKFELVEPLREIFKDEVRELGLELGLPRNMINRHPFPGPGLAIRVMGDVNKPDLDLLRRADVILLDVLHSTGYYLKTLQNIFVDVKVLGIWVLLQKNEWQKFKIKLEIKKFFVL